MIDEGIESSIESAVISRYACTHRQLGCLPRYNCFYAGLEVFLGRASSCVEEVGRGQTEYQRQERLPTSLVITSKPRGLVHSQLQGDIRVYPVRKVLPDLCCIHICVLHLVCEVLDDFEKDDASTSISLSIYSAIRLAL